MSKCAKQVCVSLIGWNVTFETKAYLIKSCEISNMQSFVGDAIIYNNNKHVQNIKAVFEGEEKK